MTGWILTAAVSALLATPAQAASDKLAIVVSAPSLGPDAAFAIETKLLDAATQIPGTNLVLRDETRIHLQAMRGEGGECSSLGCLADVGGAADAKRVLFVSATAAAVEASLIDVAARTQLGSMSTSAPAGFEQGTAARVVHGLLTPEATGSLVILVDPDDAHVFVDGERVVPGTRIDGLAVGTHAIEASRDGYASYRNDVVVTAGGLTRHELGLEAMPAESAGLSPFLLGGIGTLGAGVVIGAAGVGLALTPEFLTVRPGEEADAKARNGALVTSGIIAGGAAVIAVVAGAALTTYSFLE